MQANEDQKREVGTSPTSSPSTTHPIRRRARCQRSPVPIQELDLLEEVHHRVAKRMKQLPAYTKTTTEEDSMSEEEEQPVT